MRIFFIDNFDLFTYSLVEIFEKMGCEAVIYRNDATIKIIDDAIKKFKPSLIVISPGSGNINDAGNSIQVIQNYYGKIPIFGVGLGHLCIIEAFEGKVGRSHVTGYGKIARIKHDGKTIFKKIDDPFAAATYSSLSASDVPYSLEVSARSENGIVMGVRHKECFVEGIQFHPESILTVQGSLIIENLLREIGKK